MDVQALVDRYRDVSEKQERTLLERLLRQGWEAGCWIRPDPSLVIAASQAELEQLLGELRKRSSIQRSPVEDPFPAGRDPEPIEGTDSCYVLLSQRCDIVGILKNEPLIELAPAVRCDSKSRIRAAWKNSPREFPVDPRECPTHLVDLRYRYFISKLDLDSLSPKQALPRDSPEYQVRLRFGLRAAQRYTRAAIPDQLVESVVKPLSALVAADSRVNEIFSELALFHGGRHDRKPGLLGIYQTRIAKGLSEDEQAAQEDRARQSAEDVFYSVIEQLPPAARNQLDLDDGHRTRTVAERDLTVADWRLSWKLEWDSESFSGEPRAAIPAR